MTVGFRRTPGEIAEIQQVLSDVEFVGGESLSVDVLTRPDIVRAVLPSELEPGDRPRITAQVSRWRSNCVGDFDASAIYVSARYGDLAGDYVLTMFMDTDVPMLFGRDLYGEPKKIGTSRLARNDGHMSGTLERGGTRLIEIEADLDRDSGPTTVLGRNFNVKYQLAPDGSSIVGSPMLTMAEFDLAITVRRKATASLRLGGTVHDPLADLEIVEVIGAVYVETGMKATCVPIAPLDGEAFLPLALGRSDYWPVLGTARLTEPAPAAR
jgi:acetoacetate decarboxylase